jgi:hypothetical protein
MLYELLLPSQLTGPKPGAFLPAKGLMAAVLEVALEDYYQYAHVKGVWNQRRFAAIEAWFASNDTDWPYSFVNTCEGLGPPASAIRTAVRAHRYGPRVRCDAA